MARRIKFSAVLALALCAWWAAHPKPQNAEADARLPRATTNVRGFLEAYCYACHDSRSKKGNLDLTTLKLELADAQTFATWGKVHDRVRDGEMPPKGMERPDDATRAGFLKTLAAPMIAADAARIRRVGTRDLPLARQCR